ncbi:MAG: esterase [Calditrichia bacterium]
MHREIHNWWSPRLNKHMEIAVYGHYGFAVLMFPTAGADYLEYERFHLLDTLAPIDQGKFKVFSINSINESWLNNNMHPYDKAVRQQYNEYVLREVVLFIYTHCQGHVPIITTGASLGALHAANIFFRRPDVFDGTIAMSGVYRLTAYTRGYFDDNVYFNSPIDYLPNWGDEFTMNRMREKRQYRLSPAGSGEYEDPVCPSNYRIFCTAKACRTCSIYGDTLCATIGANVAANAAIFFGNQILGK